MCYLKQSIISGSTLGEAPASPLPPPPQLFEKKKKKKKKRKEIHIFK